MHRVGAGSSQQGAHVEYKFYDGVSVLLLKHLCVHSGFSDECPGVVRSDHGETFKCCLHEIIHVLLLLACSLWRVGVSDACLKSAVKLLEILGDVGQGVMSGAWRCAYLLNCE